MNQVEEFLGQSQAERPAEERPVEHPVEHPEEHSGEHPEEYPVEHPDRDRLMNLQECRDEYDECVSAPVGLGQQNSTVFGVDPPNAILESTHRHCAKNRRRCIDRVREREQKTEDRRQGHSLPHLPSLGNGDRLKGLQECRDQYEDCVSDTHHMPAARLGQQNSSVTTREPPDERLHCAKKHRRCIDRVREREQKIEDRGREHPFLQPPSLSMAPIDGVHATSFALGSVVTLTLGAVAYFVRRTRGTKMSDSRGAYGAATLQ